MAVLLYSNEVNCGGSLITQNHVLTAGTVPPKSLPIPISVYVIKHACCSELGEGQGEGQHLCKLGTFLAKL